MSTPNLRMEVRALAEKAAMGQPGPADIAEAERLFGIAKQEPSNALAFFRDVKYGKPPDFSTWSAIKEFCINYIAALSQVDTAMSTVMTNERLRGI